LVEEFIKVKFCKKSEGDFLERVKTGIKGFDTLLQGGIPRGSSVLLSGGAGTCKTILAMQYIYNGAVQFQEPGLFVTIESNAKNIMWNMESFNWDIKKMQEDKLMSIYKLKISPAGAEMGEIDAELEAIKKQVEELGAKRLVIDSTTALGVLIKDSATIRNTLFKFVDSIKELGCTTILTAEIEGGSKTKFSAFGVEEFLVDGVVALYFTPPHRSMFVRKMRGTNHDKNVHPFQIGADGVEIKAKEQIIWEAIK
jgi:KaiC/GvpD/RAD55 family RecA-like ATPase